MNTLQLFALEEPDFGPLSLELGPGLSVVVADSSTQLERLCEIAAGARRSRRGRVLLGNEDIYTTRAARAGCYALLPKEDLLDGVLTEPFGKAKRKHSVEQVLSSILAWKGSADEPRAALREAGLEHYLDSEATRLEPAERRALMLALALGASAPRALVLHDPFALAPLLDRDFITRRCRAQAQVCPVLVGSSSLMDAVHLGGSVQLLGGRHWVTSRELLGRAPGHVVLAVRAGRVHELAAQLAERAWIRSVEVDSELEGEGLITLQGDDLAALSASVVRASVEVAASLRRLVPLGRVSQVLP